MNLESLIIKICGDFCELLKHICMYMKGILLFLFTTNIYEYFKIDNIIRQTLC